MTHNPRPIIEWLNELPELIRELVIADYQHPTAIVSLMSEAILANVVWSKTKMGRHFYGGLWLDALYHEQNNIKLPR